MSILQAVILAIIEGITEFLPVSSTGHMIIGSSVMGIASQEFTKTFTVAIQLGAILSILVLYWKRFLQSFSFYFKLLIAFIPAAVFGLLFSKKIDALLERVDVVGYTLLLGGIFFLFVDRIFRASEEKGESEPGYLQSFFIGCFQVIAMIPGVSRSAATIIGGLSQKLNRKAAAEFSFFLAVPTMFAATAKKLYDFYRSGGGLNHNEMILLTIGNVVAFIVAMLSIRFFIGVLTKYGFRFFGYYRILAGGLILILYYFGYQLSVV